MPSVAIGIASAILIGAYHHIQELLPRAILLIFGGLFLTAITLALVKHRVFQNQRTKILILIEKDWIKSNLVKRRISRMTVDIRNLSWFQRRGAYNSFLIIMIITTLCMFGLAAYTLFSFYYC